MKIREDAKSDKEADENIKKMRKYIYIGESSRSTYERGFEQMNDMRQLNLGSHLLRHALDQHEGERLSDIKYGMHVLQTDSGVCLHTAEQTSPYP